MYCPDCGAANKVEQNFCRKCGFELKHVSAAMQARRPQSITRERRTSPIALLAKVSLLGIEGLALMGLGTVIVMAVHNMIVWGSVGPSLFVALTATILLVVITSAVFLGLIAVNKKFAKKQRPNIESDIDTAELERELLQPASISENTTQRLE